MRQRWNANRTDGVQIRWWNSFVALTRSITVLFILIKFHLAPFSLYTSVFGPHTLICTLSIPPLPLPPLYLSYFLDLLLCLSLSFIHSTSSQFCTRSFITMILLFMSVCFSLLSYSKQLNTVMRRRSLNASLISLFSNLHTE